MNTFQLISFILEAVVFICFTIAVALTPNLFTGRLERFGLNIEIRTKSSDIIERILAVAIAIVFLIYLTLPYIKDIPLLITGNFQQTIGIPENIESEDKTLFEYVHINGKEIEYLFTSKLDTHNLYRIKYLPNTKRAIFTKCIDINNTDITKNIGFPYKLFLFQVAVILGIIGSIYLLLMSLKYLGYKLFWYSCIAFYPISIYKFIKYGLNIGTWVTIDSVGFVALLFGFTSFIFLLTFDILQNRGKIRADVSGFLSQIVGVSNIIFIVMEILN
ncbi:hypothetical protein [Clostridium grantii]|uniref:Uncharacterized protein n=1 Tax=Clostridium grantii DSM 8605 TaxID=1121316 RepID=A0A1M5Y5I5_9CLOT|nr:hypothetical protein [Clostridium grantii]SHI07317.1 hypothetical protein SAMN02745207_04215 [Clostridium grantii DSM 8605]